MITEKNFIISAAQDQVATMERFKQHRALIEAHPEKFDPDKFAEATDEYMKTGRYDQTMPAWQPLDFGAYAESVAQKRTFNFDEKLKGVGNMVSLESYNMPEGYEGKFLVSLLGNNPQADADFWNKWNEADKEKYFKLADANKDNKMAPEEATNAIALWAVDTFGKNIRQSKQSIPKGRTKAVATTSGYNKKLPISDTNNDNAKYDMQGQTNLPTEEGTASLPDFMPISVKNATPIFLTIPEVYKFDEQGRTSIKKFKEAQSVLVEVLGYSPSRDMLIVKTTSSGTGDDAVFKDSQLALDASRYDKYLQSTFGLWRPGLKGRRTTQGTYVTPEAGNMQTGGKRKLY